MKAYNLVGNTFTHLTGGNKGYSVHGKEAKHIKWVPSGAEETFYIDRTLDHAFHDTTSKKKYGWLLESKHITPDIVESVKQDHKKYTDTFDLIFTHNQELLELDDKFQFVPGCGFWIKEAKIYPKRKLVSMISSNKTMCVGHIQRLQWVALLKDKVDLYGRGFQEIESKEEGLCDYMFSVAIENGEYDAYFTEKLLDCFATGTIPVYVGAPYIGDHFNIDGIIMLESPDQIDELSEEIYFSRLDAVKDNLERAKAMEVPEDYIYREYLS
tara:strand:- start:962 stop:1768 length:807 start_codon:yes stop_codon:yes gene_type:complete